MSGKGDRLLRLAREAVEEGSESIALCSDTSFGAILGVHRSWAFVHTGDGLLILQADDFADDDKPDRPEPDARCERIFIPLGEDNCRVFEALGRAVDEARSRLGGS